MSVLSHQEKLIADIVSGQTTIWPIDSDMGRFLEVSKMHGTDGILYEKLKNSPQWNHWPEEIREGLRKSYNDLVALSMIQQGELKKILERLSEVGISPIILKGAALGNTVYPVPYVRKSTDTDILVRTDDLDTLRDILGELGYENIIANEGDYITSETGYAKKTPGGFLNVLDVHWEINNSSVLSQCFDADELYSNSEKLIQLGAKARTLSTVYALIYACIHRAAHMPYILHSHSRGVTYESDRILWLYDICLLSDAMENADWLKLKRLVNNKNIRSICVDAFYSVNLLMGGLIPVNIIKELGAENIKEPSSVYLTRSPIRIEIAQLLSMPGAFRRAKYIQQHIFPKETYMRMKYEGYKMPLAALYLIRIMSGTTRLGASIFRNSIISRWAFQRG